MNTEKIFKREDGSKVKVTVSHYDDHRHGIMYNVSVSICGIKKRKFECLVNTNSYAWRALSLEDRRKDNMRQALSVLSADEINEALKEHWGKLIPMPENTIF